MALLIDPAVPETMALVSMTAGGLMRTVDGGANWELIPYQPARGTSALLNAVEDPLVPGNYIAGGIRASMQEFQVAPDITVSLGGIADRLPLGATPVLAATVQNVGPYSASAVQLVLNLPAALSPGAVTTPRGTCNRVGLQITCQLGALQVGERVVVSVATTVAAGSGTATATVSAREADPVSSNNSASLSTVVQATADLSAELTGPRTIDHGTEASLSLRVANAGPNSTGYVADLQVPAGLAIRTVSGGPGTCATVAAILRCQGASLGNGEAAIFDITVRGSSVGLQDLSLVATAAAFDSSAANNSAALSIAVRPVTDLGVSQIDAPATLRPNQGGTATVSIANNGTDDAGIVVATIAGTGLEILGATPSVGSCALSGGTANCSLGGLPAGATRTITVNVVGRASGTAQITASTNFAGNDTVAGNNTLTRSVTITPVADTVVTLASGPAQVQAGQQSTVDFTVSNAGPDDAPSVSVSVSATGLELQSATTPSGACTITNGAASCSLSNLAVGANRSITATFLARTAGAGSLASSVTSAGTDPVAANNSVSYNVTISAAPAPAPSPGSGGTSSGSGGGGSTDRIALLALAVLLLSRLRFPRRCTRSPMPCV
jgi:hypothetical protein